MNVHPRIHGSRLAACVACSLEHTASSKGVMSPSINAASIPVQWCARGTANHVHTYVHVHGPHSLVPVAGWHRWLSPPESHLAAGATAAWRLIRVFFQAICCVAAGSRRVCYIIRCTFGRGHALSCCSPLLEVSGACLLALYTCCCCVSSCIAAFDPQDTTTYIACRFACRLTSTRRLNRCPRAQAKSAFPNASGRINLEN